MPHDREPSSPSTHGLRTRARLSTTSAALVALALSACTPSVPPSDSNADAAQTSASASSATAASSSAGASASAQTPALPSTPLRDTASPSARGGAAAPDARPWKRLQPTHTAGLLGGVAALDGDRLAAVTHDGEVFAIGTDGRWEALRAPLPVPAIDIASARSSDGKRTTLAVLDQEGRVYMSEDAGATWAEKHARPTDLPDLFDPVMDVIASPFRELHARRVGDAVHLLAVGGTGRALWSRDGGATWAIKHLGARNELWGGTIGPEGTLAVVGDRAQVYTLAPDAGDAWVARKTSSKEPWRAVAIVQDAPLRMAVCGLKGRCAWFDGASWSDRSTAALWSAVDLEATSDKRWLAATAQGALLETRDGGKRWREVRASDGRSLARLAPTESGGWALAGSEVIVRGDKGLKKWTTLRGDGVDTLNDVWSGPSLSVAVGDRGLMWVKRGDDAWKRRQEPGWPSWTSVSFAVGRYGWATGDDGTLWKTEDGAVTWTPVKTFKGDPNQPLMASAALDTRNVFIGGAQGKLWSSGDRGASWRALELPMPSGAGIRPDVIDLTVVRSEAGPGLLGGGERGQLFTKAAGGRDWTRRELTALSSIVDVEAQGAAQWLLDRTGMVLGKTNASEALWRVLAVPAGFAWTAMSVSPDQTLALADSGALMRSSDGGQTWHLLPYQSKRLMTDLAHAGGAVFVMVGHGGIVLRSQDNGLTWTSLGSKTSKALTTVVRDGDALLACGFAGVCLSSQDQGATWGRWEASPPDLGAGHVTSMDRDAEGRLALTASANVLVRDTDGAWTTLKPKNDATASLRTIRRVRIAGDEVWAIGGDGRLWRREGDALVHTPLPAPPNSARQIGRAKDLSLTSAAPLKAVVLTHDTRMLSLTREGDARDGAPAVAAYPDAPARVTRSALRWIERAGARTWLLGPGGLWGRADGQSAFAQVLPALACTPQALAFAPDGTTGYAACGDGTVLRTDSGGAAWATEHTGSRTPLHALTVAPDGSVLAAGRGGALFQRAAP